MRGRTFWRESINLVLILKNISISSSLRKNFLSVVICSLLLNCRLFSCIRQWTTSACNKHELIAWNVRILARILIFPFLNFDDRTSFKKDQTPFHERQRMIPRSKQTLSSPTTFVGSWQLTWIIISITFMTEFFEIYLTDVSKRKRPRKWSQITPIRVHMINVFRFSNFLTTNGWISE